MLLPDEELLLSEKLIHYADRTPANLILTTGGTGFTSRDVTPEATRAALDREAPGFAEAMRAASLAKTPHAMLSRAVSGLRGTTLIINFPGSPDGLQGAVRGDPRRPCRTPSRSSPTWAATALASTCSTGARRGGAA